MDMSTVAVDIEHLADCLLMQMVAAQAEGDLVLFPPHLVQVAVVVLVDILRMEAEVDIQDLIHMVKLQVVQTLLHPASVEVAAAVIK
jgi:hypothetical protein